MAAGLERWVRDGVERKRTGRPTALDAGRHGQLAAYRAGCRCPRCVAAQRDYHRAWRAANKLLHQRPAVWKVAAGPTRRLLLELRAAGWSLHAIATAGGIAETTVRRALDRSTSRVWSTTAAAVREVAELRGESSPPVERDQPEPAPRGESSPPDPVDVARRRAQDCAPTALDLPEPDPGAQDCAPDPVDLAPGTNVPATLDDQPEPADRGTNVPPDPVHRDIAPVPNGTPLLGDQPEPDDPVPNGTPEVGAT